MAIDYGEHGVEYTHDLCDAIERYVATVERQMPGGFHWRGMRLGSALERHLYSVGVNSPALFRVWLHGQGMAPKAPHPDGRVERALAPLLAGSDPVMPSRVPRVAWMLRNLVARGRNSLRARRRLKSSLMHVEHGLPEVLVHIGNAKFARYLAPILKGLPKGSAAFLACSDYELAQQLDTTGHHVIWAEPPPYGMYELSCPPALRSWGGIVHLADSTLDALAHLRPRAVLVVEGNAPLDAITAEACRVLGIPCYCVQQGWSPVFHSGFRNMAFSGGMFTWGDEFSAMLAAWNPGQVFHVSGSHVVQRRVRQRADSANCVSFFLQGPCALLGEAAYEAFAALAAELAERNPGTQFIVRPHPSHPLPAEVAGRYAAMPNLRISDPTVEHLADVLEQSVMAVSVFSTVLLEAMAMQVVPIVCSIGAMKKYYPDLAGLGAAIEVHDIQRAREVIEELIANPAELEVLRQRLPEVSRRFFADQDAVHVICNHLLSGCQISEDAAQIVCEN